MYWFEPLVGLSGNLATGQLKGQRSEKSGFPPGTCSLSIHCTEIGTNPSD